MDVYELVEAVGGEIVNGEARVREGRKYITLGRLTPQGIVMTEEGKQKADELTAPKVKPTRGKKKADEAAEETQEPSVEGDITI